MDTESEKTITKTSKNESVKPARNNNARGRSFGHRGRIGWVDMRVGHAVMKNFGPPGRGRGRVMDEPFNGVGPIRGMGRMRPYPDLRDHRGRAGLMGVAPHPPSYSPPPPMHFRGPFPHMSRHGPPPRPALLPPPPGHPAFRGHPPHPIGRSGPPFGPPRHFPPHTPRRSYHNGPVSPPPHPPPGRGHWWPGPPVGQRF